MPLIDINGIKRDVSVTTTATGVTVTVEGRRYDVRDVARMTDSVSFFLGNESHVARVSNGTNGAQLSVGGRTYRLREEAAEADRPAAARGGDGRLEAPMPGTIIAVHVSEGDRVIAGQPLVVLESMKMHNEISSPVDGVVRKVTCRAGERVNFGQVLVEVGADSK